MAGTFFILFIGECFLLASVNGGLLHSSPRRYVSKETAEKSKSLESHTSASRQHRHGSQPAFCRPFYPPNGSEKTDESAKSLDIAVEVYKKKYDAGCKSNLIYHWLKIYLHNKRNKYIKIKCKKITTVSQTCIKVNLFLKENIGQYSL